MIYKMKGFCNLINTGVLVTLLSFPNLGAFCQTRTLTAFPNVNFNTPYIESRYDHASLANGYYESLPPSYSSTTQKYPVLIFFHGYGEVGNGSASDLLSVRNSGGIMPYLRNGTLPGDFIVIAPQYRRPPDTGPGNGSGTANSVVNYVLANYPRADPTRIYLGGLSAGGGIALYGVGRYVEDGKRIAGVVTMAGAANYYDWARNAGFARVPLWAFVNSGDDQYYIDCTNQWVDESNKINVASPVAKKTIFALPGHGSWNEASNPSYREGGKNIYEWLLSYQRIGDVVLPVALATYNVFASTSGTSSTQKVTVNWTTTHEQNNSFFTISRSADGISFTEAGKVPAATQGQGNSYTFTDPSPLNGISYYRLSQTDADGTTKSFDIKSVTVGNRTGEDMARVYPIPASDQLILEINNKVTGKLNATIINAEGKVLFTKVFSKPSGFAREVINIGSLAKGLYMLKVNGDTYLSTLRFIKE